MASLSREQRQYMADLYEEMHRRLTLYAQSFFPDGALAEECVQDVFQIACAKAGELERSPNPQGWLMNALKFVMRNRLRKQARAGALFVSYRELDENIPGRSRDVSPEMEAVCLQVLGERDWRLLRRVALKEATIREAAAEFGLTEEACSKRVQRSKKKLRQFFEQEEV